MKKSVILILFLIFLSGFASAALGISPAVKKYDFEPLRTIVISFDVISDKPDQEIEIFASGDLSEYVTLSKDKTVGPGVFKAIIKLPASLEKPGDHFLSIGAREIPPDETSFLGSVIDVRSTIKISAPFPGRYVEADLTIHDGNIDEEIPVELLVKNRGKEDLDVNVYVDFFDGNKDNVFRMDFKPAEINSTDERYFRKFLDTSGLKPGDYLAEAVISYGDETRTEDTFRVGSLFVNVTNFTEVLPIKEGFQEFYIGIESRWNENLGEVFADVNISNEIGSVDFRTPSSTLSAWEKGELVGFIDTENMNGEYDVEITLKYSGEETIVNGRLKVTELDGTIVIVIVGIAIILIIAIVVFLLLLKRKKKKKKK